MKDNKFLESEKISKLLLKFSIPCVLSLLISSLYNIVDQIFIGNSDLGYLGNAATTIVFPVTVIAVAFAWCLGDGAAAYLSLCQGKNDTTKAHKAIGNGVLVTLIISIILVIIGFVFRDNILYLFGATDKSIGYAKDYFVIIMAALPVYMLMNMVNSVIRADGSPVYAMASMLTGAIANIILDPVFIFALDMGIKGAAYATVIGQILSFVVSLSYFFRTKVFKLRIDSFKLEMPTLMRVIKLGVSTFITQMAIVVISLVCNMMLVKYGEASKYGQDIPIAVVGIAMKVFTIVINIIVGVILGGQPILGYNYGARRFDRVKETFKLVSMVTVVVGLIATVVFELCPNLVIGIFGTQSDIYTEFAVLTFRIFLMLVLATCYIKMASIFFQAIGKPVSAAVVSLLRDIICFVPLAIVLPRFMGIEGVLWAAPIADLIGLIVTVILLVRFFRGLDNSVVFKEERVSFKKAKPGVIITIAREHGSGGKYIGELVAKKLGIPYYDKELTALAAKESGLASEFISDVTDDKPGGLYDIYLSSTPASYAIKAQSDIIKKIASSGSCVIVGRSADYVLRDYDNVIRIFIYANSDYKIEMLHKMYGDDKKKAKRYMEKADKARRIYYNNISGNNWGDKSNYDLCIDSSIGPEKTAKVILEYIKGKRK